MVRHSKGEQYEGIGEPDSFSVSREIFACMKIKLFVLISLLLAPTSVLAGVIDEAQPLSVGLTNILNFLLSIVGVVAIIGLAISGFLYFFAAGDMRQIALAKKTTLGAITGIVIALGSYLLVRAVAVLVN